MSESAVDLPQPNRRRRLRRVLMIGGPLAVLIGVGLVYLTGGRYADTDNAYVHTHKVSVSADISGRVVDLKVHENQPVKKGDVLFQLDPEPLQIAVDQAHANVEDARNKIIGLKAAYRTRQEDLKAAEANLGFAQRELQRREKLVAGKIISQSDYDEARNRYNVAVNDAASIRQDISRIISELGGNPDVDPETHPTYRMAQAALADAELNMRRGTVVAPADGVVAQVDALRPGDYINAGSPVFSIVSQQDAWIEANLKETDLTYVKPGQTAEVTIDTYPGSHLHRRGRQHRHGDRRRVQRAAGTERQRQLGQGGAAHPGPAARHRPARRRHPARRHERGGGDRHRASPRPVHRAEPRAGVG